MHFCRVVCYIKRMKTAGDILSTIFDERFVKKAQGYSKLFDSWADITAKNGIAAVAAHSRIKDLDRGILLVEMDHPGWKQILQTKQSKLLNDFCRRFPELDISGISLMLGRSEEGQSDEQGAEEEIQPENNPSELSVFPSLCENENSKTAGIDAIKDNDFKESIMKLGQTIAKKEKNV